jgi:hypothetical protein
MSTPTEIEVKYADALKALHALLLKHENDHGRDWTEVEVIVSDRGGVRVCEISYTKQVPGGMCGASVMRGTPEACDLLLACEEFLITHHIKPYRPEGWTSDIDDHGDAVWLLEDLLAKDEKKAAA